jgi:hypothetical protein
MSSFGIWSAIARDGCLEKAVVGRKVTLIANAEICRRALIREVFRDNGVEIVAGDAAGGRPPPSAALLNILFFTMNIYSSTGAYELISQLREISSKSGVDQIGCVMKNLS